MIYTIPNLFFVFLIAVLTGYLTFLTTKGSLTNRGRPGIWKKLTHRGKIVFFVLLGMSVLLVLQEVNNQNSRKNSETLLKQEQDDRDTKISKGIKKGVDSAHKKLFSDISLAFKKQGYKIDTLNNEIVRLKQLKRTVINNTLVESEPTLYIPSSNGIYSSGNSYWLTIKTNGAGATNLDIKVYLFLLTKSRKDRLEKLNLFRKEMKITSHANTRIVDLDESFEEIYVYLKGSYSNLSQTKSYDLDFLHFFNKKDGFQFAVTDKKKDSIVARIKELDL